MTNNIIPMKATGKTELKVKAAAIGAYALSLAASVFLATTATDFVTALPDWLEALVYPIIPAAGAWVAGYQRRSQPENLSASTIAAVQEWLTKHAPRKPGF